MKRVALKRKTPLRRGGRLRPMSRAKAAMQPRYRAAVRGALQAQIDERGFNWCTICGQPCNDAGPHHPLGRVGERLMQFMIAGWACCHRAIHDATKSARKKGLLG